MKRLLSWVGPAAVVASVAYVYAANHPSSAQMEKGIASPFPLSTVRYCGILCLLYASGVMPRNLLFPSFVFRRNMFALLYKLYCSYPIGYRIIRPLMHQPVAYPHSDYRNGIRCIDAGSPLRLKPPPPGTPDTLPFLTRFYERAGGVVDAALWNASITRGVAIVPIPIFRDNYAYLIVSMQTHKVAAVDPADPAMTLRAIESLRAQLGVPLQLTEVLTTHKHWDHAGGNEMLVQLAKKEVPLPSREEADGEGASNIPLLDPQLRLIGSKEDAPLCCDVLVSDASPVFSIIGGAAKVQVMAVPGHTNGSVVFAVGSAEEGVFTTSRPRVAVFTGDSLFCGGFGALFEVASIDQIMKARATFLKDPRMRTQPATGQKVEEEDILLYVGHEYTERLLSEVVTLITRVLEKSRSSGDSRGREYARAVAEALRGVKMLRIESDGLEDASGTGCETERQKPQFRLPSCTVPSSLAVEKIVNPFLTVDDEVLAALRETEKYGSMDSCELERCIYCSERRRLPPEAE
ncbi:hypothetical protein LSCM1_02368 [Leishmania martiniquensis]|uniref:hydroxyacylglutathione hydrolase n=1 Tax=Leishmania martiniquensis TaxID=1580590 RepID=A0A836H1R5_9TRYP|nr:hypothetical protein LSCM1_02368 [Leishmania martiniquensis]